MYSLIVLLGFLAIFTSTLAEKDEIYILIDAVSLFSCRGITNRMKVDRDDIIVADEQGNEAYFIKGPGSYKIVFRKIKVLDDFKHLTGEISASLQVPIIEGPVGLRFDLPYRIIPEQRLLDQSCDDLSGVVTRGSRSYCRYCDICKTSSTVESSLNRGHKFLPEIVGGKEKSFTPVCKEIESDTYKFERTITLPAKSVLEKEAKKNAPAVSDEVKKRLDKGRGKFHVFLNLISSDSPTVDLDKYLESSTQCRCCSKRSKELIGCNVLRFLYCSKESCKTLHANQCLGDDPKIVGCLSVEFNYRLTTDYNEVKAFLKSKGLSEPTASPKPAKSTRKPRNRAKAGRPVSRGLRAKCISQIPKRMNHLIRYCRIFWDRKLCCDHCKSVC